MKKLLLSLVIASFALACTTVPNDQTPLSAGVTAKPNTNYAVIDTMESDFEPPHDTRVDDPYKDLVPTLASSVPVQLRPHSRLVLTDIEDRTFFDYFAWQTFVGLVWPADSVLRGVPDQGVTADSFPKFNSTGPDPRRVPVVWETFRTFDAALPNPPAEGPPPAQPQPWNGDRYERPFDLDLTAKGKHPVELDEAFSSPLIDQNRQYVRYSLQLNEVMYEFIRQNKWYLKENLPKSPTPATLPPLPVDTSGNIVQVQQPQTNTIITQPVNGNSIELKSAWRIMITEEDTLRPWRRVDDLSRYFVSTANVSNAVTGEVTTEQVGLVGLHIVVKTPQFTQGIWASFEHVDNLEAPDGRRASFNSGGQFQPQGFSYEPRVINDTTDAVPEASRKPVEVSRIYKIPDTPVGTAPTLPDGLSTRGLNRAFQRLLAGTVWQYYQLVITQWPTDPTSFYAKPFFYPRGFPPGSTVDPDQPQSVKDAYARADSNAANAYPRWSGLPIPQTGSLNTTMETYFQNPASPHSLESTSCMGCHYAASDTDYSWALKLRTWPQPYDQGRIHAGDSELARKPANSSQAGQAR